MYKQLIYVADPMCSWCWGFSPVIEAVRDRFAKDLPMQLLLGGLSPGTTETMDNASKAYIREHWEHVHKATGQPFELGFFERKGFVYDTEPPSRAVVIARRRNSETAFSLLKIIQKAFYAENRDVTDSKILGDLAAKSGIDTETFTSEFEDEKTLEETLSDFAATRRLGISGFPALIAGSDSAGYEIITIGYRPFEKVEELITSWFKR